MSLLRVAVVYFGVLGAGRGVRCVLGRGYMWKYEVVSVAEAQDKSVLRYTLTWVIDTD